MAAVLLHPHPDRGGDQYNNVVTALYDRLPAVGIAPHRFDFVSSDVDVARSQTVDVIEAAGESVYLVGYSFGGGVAATIDHPAILGWCLIAPALTLLASVNAPAIGPDPRPKYVIAAEHDAWFSPGVLFAATAGWTATSYASVAGTDHFFRGGAADQAAELAVAWIQLNRSR